MEGEKEDVRGEKGKKGRWKKRLKGREGKKEGKKEDGKGR
jgi:hypothetical protein